MDKMKRKKLAAILITFAAVFSLMSFVVSFANNVGIGLILIHLFNTIFMIFCSTVLWIRYAKFYIDCAIQQKLNENQKGDSDA